MTSLPTGEQLYQELRAAAAAAKAPLGRFAEGLYPAGDVQWKLEQLRIARRPLQRTVARVRALIAGQDVAPPAAGAKPAFDPRYQQFTRAQCEAFGLPPSRRSVRDRNAVLAAQLAKENTAILRALTEQAHQDRRPGQTIADRVRELRQELAA